MRFIVCWTCGYSTSIKGGGADEVKGAKRILEEHTCGGSDKEIITKDKLE